MDDDVNTSLQRNCVWLMANLCRGKKPLPNEQMVSINKFIIIVYCFLLLNRYTVRYMF